MDDIDLEAVTKEARVLSERWLTKHRESLALLPPVLLDQVTSLSEAIQITPGASITFGACNDLAMTLEFGSTELPPLGFVTAISKGIEMALEKEGAGLRL